MINLVIPGVPLRPWQPLATVGDPCRPLATCLKMTILGDIGHSQACELSCEFLFCLLSVIGETYSSPDQRNITNILYYPALNSDIDSRVSISAIASHILSQIHFISLRRITNDRMNQKLRNF